MNYKAVFIDWDGTLSISRFWQHWQDSDPETYRLIQKELFNDRPELIHDWMWGKVSSEEVTTMMAGKVGLPPARLLEGLTESCQAMEFVESRIPDYVSCLRKKGIKVIIATDNMDTFYRWTIPALNLETMFDDVLDSARLRVMKKEPDKSGRSAFFGKYLHQNNLEPAESLLIDDSPSNAVVERFGINFSLIERGKGLAPQLKELSR